MSLRKLVAKALVWTTLESFTLSGLSLISLFIFARLLSPEDFGVAAIALAIVQVLTVPVELLFHDALVQRKELTAIARRLGVHVLGGARRRAVVRLLVRLGADREADRTRRGVGHVLKWMSLSLVGMGFGCVLVAMQRRKLEFRSLALRSLLGRGGSAMVAITLAFKGAGVWSLVAQQVLLVCLGHADVVDPGGRAPALRFPGRRRRACSASACSRRSTSCWRWRFSACSWCWSARTSAARAPACSASRFEARDMLRDLMCTAVYQIAMPLFSRLREDRETLFAGVQPLGPAHDARHVPGVRRVSRCAPTTWCRSRSGSSGSRPRPTSRSFHCWCLQFFMRMYGVTLMRAVGKPAAPSVELIVQTVVAAGVHGLVRAPLGCARRCWRGRARRGDQYADRHVHSAPRVGNELSGDNCAASERRSWRRRSWPARSCR